MVVTAFVQLLAKNKTMTFCGPAVSPEDRRAVIVCPVELGVVRESPLCQVYSAVNHIHDVIINRRSHIFG